METQQNATVRDPSERAAMALPQTSPVVKHLKKVDVVTSRALAVVVLETTAPDPRPRLAKLEAEMAKQPFVC
jgi:hypothetical protein